MVIAHIVHEPPPSFRLYNHSTDKPNTLQPMDIAAEDALNSLLYKLRTTYSDLSPLHNAETILVAGIPQTRIVEVAKMKDIQLIVTGHRNRSRLGKILNGSIAEHLIQTADAPVVVISG